MTPKEKNPTEKSGAQTGSEGSRSATMSLDPRHGHERPPVETPSNSDVLAGRGNACNYHPGNEYFRALVSKHKRAYVACSKPQKAKFSRLIVDEIYSRNGRFLKQDNTTQLWHDIGDKKALDKTRQALREGAPELLKEIKTSDSDSDEALAERYPSMAAVGSTPPDNAAFTAAGIAAGGIAETPFAPLLHVAMPAPASTPVIQNRSRVNFRSMHPPSLRALPAELVANAHRQTNQEMEALHRKLAALYTPDQFEPTPINPNLQLNTLREKIRVEPTTPVRVIETLPLRRPPSGSRLERSDSTDSLDIRKVFTTGNTEEQLSQQLSNMSFSVGEIAAISDESNLTSVFDESAGIRENSGENAKTQKGNNKSMNLSNGFNDMSLTSLVGVESNFAADEANILGNLSSFAGDSNLGNMSSLTGELNVGNFMSTTSISRVFDESTDKM